MTMMQNNDQPHIPTLAAGLIAAAMPVFLCSCSAQSSNARELGSYREEMVTFFDDLTTAQNDFENIDIAADDAEQSLLTAIDEISAACTRISSIDAPSGLEAVQEKAEHAGAMMGQASSGFHNAFESVDLDQDAYDAAMEYYKSAGNDIQEMIQLLQNSFDN